VGKRRYKDWVVAFEEKIEGLFLLCIEERRLLLQIWFTIALFFFALIAL
jgi:hypothetical protein